MAVAAAVVDLDAGPAKLLDPAVGPHPAGLVERAVTVRLLLEDHHEHEVVEPERHVEPPEAVERLVRRAAGWIGVTRGTDPPRPVARAHPRRSVDVALLPADAQPALPGSDLREALGVEDRPVAGQQEVALLEDGVE